MTTAPMKHPCRWPYGAIVSTPLPLGEAQTDATVAAMAGMLAGSLNQDRAIRAHALDDLSRRIDRCKAADHSRPEVCAVWTWLLDHFVYQPDPPGEETLKAPLTLYYEATTGADRHAAGDCDDRALLTAYLLKIAGLSPAFVVMSRENAGPWQHIAAAAMTAAGPFLVDTQEAAAPGEWPAGVRRYKVYEL